MITENNNYSGSKLDSVNMPLDGITLIEAAAGTGKTYNIQNIAARLIVEKNYPIETLAIVTFTEKATKELADRMRNMLELLIGVLNNRSSANAANQARAKELLERFTAAGVSVSEQKKRLEEALRNIDDCRVSTIHGFCFRLLSEYAFESNMTFQVKLEKNIRNVIDKLLKDFCRNKRCGNIDLPGWTELTPDVLSSDVYKLLNCIGVKLVHERPVFTDENAIVEHLKKLQNQFSALPDKQETLEKLQNRLNKICNTDPASYLSKCTEELKKLAGFNAQTRWESWYEVIKNFRTSNFLGKGKAPTKAYPENKKMVDLYVTNQELFTIAEEYCMTIEHDCEVFLIEDAVKFIRHNLEQWKINENCMDYNDLLIQANRALLNRNFRRFIQKKFNAGIIDEFQDTDPLQYSIFKSIFIERPDGKRLIMVGDPRQAIYSFRGGDMATYLTARRECMENQGRIYTLTTNYRSSEKMIDSFNRVFTHNDPFFTDEIVFEQVEKPSFARPGIRFQNKEMEFPLSVQYYPENNREEIFEFCAEEISCMVGYGEFTIPDGNGSYRKIMPGDIAVLATDNKFLEMIRHALAQYNIPAVGERPGGVWCSDEAAEMAEFMQAVLDNNNRSLIRSALMTRIGGVELQELDMKADDAAEKMIGWHLKFIELNECWYKKGTSAFMVLLMKMFALKEKLTVKSGGDRTLSNYIQLGDLLAAAELSYKLPPRGVLKFLQEKIAGNSDDNSEILESDRSAVHLLTVHKSKGLQFPIVFLPQLSARMPLTKKDLKTFHRDGILCCNVDRLDREALILAGLEEMQEIMRLVYVAITRACHFCRITWGKGMNEKKSPMTWLFAHQQTAKDNELRKSFVSGNVPFAPDDINIMPEMRQDDLLKKYFATTYLAAFNDEIIEPETVETPGCRRYIISYSALNELSKNSPYTAEEDFTDRDSSDAGQVSPTSGEIAPEAPEAEKSAILTGGIWDIPAGAAIGNAWHEILENTDFTVGVEFEMMKNIMANYGFREPNHLAASAEMFKRLLEYQLPCGMKLKELSHERRLTELEFLLSSPTGFSFQNITDAVNEYMLNEFNAKISSSGFLNMYRGFFTGFIDMVFEYNNKLYIVDWKSNTSGLQKAAFYGEKLKEHMYKNLYPLQYLCYLAALLKFLEQRLQKRVDEELYNRYVGGVYYIFLRGMMLNEPGGVFSATVPYKTVRALADVISCGKEE